MSCILRAGGKFFDVDDFIGSSLLIADSIWHKGEEQFSNGTTNKTNNKSSGIRIVASEAEFSELSKQIEDAILFLLKNHDDVSRLSSFLGVEYAILDFGAEIYPPSWSSFTFPPELLSLAGSACVSLCLSVYPTEYEADTGQKESASL